MNGRWVWMNRVKKVLFCLVLMMCLTFGIAGVVYADSIDDVGGTGQGDIGGTNVYTFSYIYRADLDAIVLRVDTKVAINSFGGTTTHTFESPDDNLVLHTQNPRLGSSLESAIEAMNAAGGYNLSVADAKAKLGALGYYDKGNGVWKYDGGYLTYISAVKIRPQKHTVTYNANGGTGAPGNQTKNQGVTLTLSSTKPTRTGYTFKYWTASIGGTYNPGGSYTHDQDGGTVTMTAYWKDETAPNCSTFTATPNTWSKGNGTVTIKAKDEGSGISSIVLKRYSYVTGAWSDIKSWTSINSTSEVTKTYSQTAEGVYLYQVVITDVAGNKTTKNSSVVYLDHTKPVINGTNSTVTDWTNTAPVISVTATDYLSGTTYNGSGVIGVVIANEEGVVKASGTNSATYTLKASDEGIHTWTIIATDGVGWQTMTTVTTKYDKTAPGMDGTEVVYVKPDGTTVSGYCQDNIINQHIDDAKSRSLNNPNVTSGLKSVIVYKYYKTGSVVLYGDTVKKTFTTSDTNSYFDVYYEMPESEKDVLYYLIVVKDFAGNTTKKKLVSQQSMLTWFHTSIERNSYE